MRDNFGPGANGRANLALVLSIAVFGLLRLAASLDDFYIDEIWSFFFARQMQSFSDVFRLNHDNNHIINTLYLYLLGGEPYTISGRPTFLPHRLLSIITGTASLWIIWKIALQKGRVEAFTAVFLAGLSFPLIVYSSEARGYGPAIMFALASFLFCREYLSGKGVSAAVLFWLAAIAAFLSHSSFIYIYSGMTLWSVLALSAQRRKGEAIWRLAVLHSVPSLFLMLYYSLFLKGMVYGGGETPGTWSEVLLTASMVFGSRSGGLYGYISIASVLLLSIAGLLAIRSAAKGEPVFFISAIFAAPALIVLVMKPEFLYFRYFLICFPFFYLLSAYAISGLYRKGVLGKTVFSIVLALFGSLSLWSTADHVMRGRGSYVEALEYMTGATEGHEVVIGSDHDFRNKLVLDFYSGFFKDKRIVYLDGNARRDYVPEWMIRHSVDVLYSPPAYLYESGQRFTLERTYGYSGVSGWGWFVYRNDKE